MRNTRTPAPPARSGNRRNRQVRTVVVCLPPSGPQPLPELAATELRMFGISAIGPIPHFVTHIRRTSKLVDRWHGMTSGGPIRMLDLTTMRNNAAAAAAALWQIWHQVTAGTRPAQPFWFFTDRHRADPRRYSLQWATAEYLAQPRVVAMNTYNALPHRVCELPTAALEAFQAGHGTYINLAWLAAVPADGLAPSCGGWLTPASERLTDQLAYLHAANIHIGDLNPGHQLVAMAVPVHAASSASSTSTPTSAASTTEAPA